MRISYPIVLKIYIGSRHAMYKTLKQSANNAKGNEWKCSRTLLLTWINFYPNMGKNNMLVKKPLLRFEFMMDFLSCKNPRALNQYEDVILPVLQIPL